MDINVSTKRDGFDYSLSSCRCFRSQSWRVCCSMLYCSLRSRGFNAAGQESSFCGWLEAGLCGVSTAVLHAQHQPPSGQNFCQAEYNVQRQTLIELQEIICRQVLKPSLLVLRVGNWKFWAWENLCNTFTASFSLSCLLALILNTLICMGLVVTWTQSHYSHHLTDLMLVWCFHVFITPSCILHNTTISCTLTAISKFSLSVIF